MAPATKRSDKRIRGVKIKIVHRATVVVINISPAAIFPSLLRRTLVEEERRELTAKRTASVARVVAGYQFNRFSMNGRIGFLKVPGFHREGRIS